MDVTEHDLDKMDAYLKEKRKRQSHAQAVIRKHRDGNGARAKRNDLVKQKDLNLEQVSHLEYEAWKLRVMGKPVWEIASIMQTTSTQVHVWLQDALAQVRAKTQDWVELDRELELSRTEELLQHYMPLAVCDRVVVERIQQGEPVGLDDIEQPQRCAYIVMELIKLRAKLKGLVISEAERTLLPAVDVVGWLRTHHEFIRAAAQEAPKDVLTLECDEPIDEQPQAQTNTNQPGAQGLPDAV
jgi:hypothetical protein